MDNYEYLIPYFESDASILPYEIFSIIFTFCDAQTLLNLRGVNHWFKENVSKELPKFNLRVRLNNLLFNIDETISNTKNFKSEVKKDVRTIRLLQESCNKLKNTIQNMLLVNDNNQLINCLNFPLNNKYNSIFILVNDIVSHLMQINDMIKKYLSELPQNFNITELYIYRYNYMLTLFFDHTVSNSEIIKQPLLKSFCNPLIEDQFILSLDKFKIIVLEIVKYVDYHLCDESVNLINLLYAFCDFPMTNKIYLYNINLLGIHFGDLSEMGTNIINMYKFRGFTGFMNLYDAAEIVYRDNTKYLTRFSRQHPENLVVSKLCGGIIKHSRFHPQVDFSLMIDSVTYYDPIKIKVQPNAYGTCLQHIVKDSGYLVEDND